MLQEENFVVKKSMFRELIPKCILSALESFWKSCYKKIILKPMKCCSEKLVSEILLLKTHSKMHFIHFEKLVLTIQFWELYSWICFGNHVT